MTSEKTNPVVAHEPYPAIPTGLPAFCQMAFDGRALAPVLNKLVHWVRARPRDPAALFDLSTNAQLQRRPS